MVQLGKTHMQQQRASAVRKKLTTRMISNAFKKERNYYNVQSPCCRNTLRASIPAATQKGACVCAELLQSMLSCYSRGRLCDPMDCRPPGSSVHGVLQAKILEWIALPCSRGIFHTQRWNLSALLLLHWQVGSVPLVPSGKPH